MPKSHIKMMDHKSCIFVVMKKNNSNKNSSQKLNKEKYSLKYFWTNVHQRQKKVEKVKHGGIMPDIYPHKKPQTVSKKGQKDFRFCSLCIQVNSSWLNIPWFSFKHPEFCAGIILCCWCMWILLESMKLSDTFDHYQVLLYAYFTPK